MSCHCIISGNNFFASPDLEKRTIQKARKEYICCECRAKIKKGEHYEYTSGMWDGDWDTYKTCIDCVSVKEALFCDYVYGEVWEDVAEMLRSSGEMPPYDCVKDLTKVARDKLCDLLESFWEDKE